MEGYKGYIARIICVVFPYIFVAAFFGIIIVFCVLEDKSEEAKMKNCHYEYIDVYGNEGISRMCRYINGNWYCGSEDENYVIKAKKVTEICKNKGI